MKKVITFGVFDLLHKGHVILFEKAKKCGDYLIVAVQDNESVLKYKPEANLYYTCEERKYMVQSIKFVDEVVVYKDVDKDIKNIDFDVFFKGEDQNHAGFKRAEEWCRENGKEVVIGSRTQGISSTMLRGIKDVK